MEKTKNCWIIPTDKPSRLHFDHTGLFLSKNYQLSTDINSIVKGKNIYITSDEEIKVEDWCFEVHNGDSKATSPKFIDEQGNTWWLRKANANDIAGCPTTKKIILTTDQDLINDGVQKIDDEFLEWFVNNPSCNEVEVRYSYPTIDDEGDGSISEGYWLVIIPKEEPKQETLEERVGKKAVEYCKKYENTFKYNDIMLAIEFGYQLAQQELYNEEEVEDIVEKTIEKFYKHRYSDKTKAEMKILWFEQFKKK